MFSFANILPSPSETVLLYFKSLLGEFDIPKVAPNFALREELNYHKNYNIPPPRKQCKYNVTKNQLIEAFKKYAIKDREEYSILYQEAIDMEGNGKAIYNKGIEIYIDYWNKQRILS